MTEGAADATAGAAPAPRPPTSRGTSPVTAGCLLAALALLLPSVPGAAAPPPTAEDEPLTL